MTRVSRGRSARSIAALVLVLGLALMGAGFAHTDDGCAVETHCAACVFALSLPEPPTLATNPQPAVREMGPLALREHPSPTGIDLDTPAPRGPPRAL